MLKHLKLFITTLTLAIFPIITRAAEIIPYGCKRGTGSIKVCGLNEVIQVFVNIYDIGIQYVGAVSVLFFIIGGFMLLISGGRSNLVDMGKKIIIGSVVGLFIVLTSFLLVRMVQTNLLEANIGVINEEKNENCVGRPNGFACARSVNINGVSRLQNVYTCIDQKCSSTTQCTYQFKNANAKNCWLDSLCAPDTTTKNLCPGDTNIVCCEKKIK